MGEIRSALDIALEKTDGIKGDSQAIENEKIKNRGKKAAALFLGGGAAKDLAAEAAETLKKDRQKFIEGALPIFCAAVRLPEDEEEALAPRRWAEGLKVILPRSGLEALFRQAEVIFMQYLEEREAFCSSLEEEFMPLVKAREEELSRRYGQPVSISLRQDAEYSATLSKGLKALQGRYASVINEIRGRIMEAAGAQGD